MFFKKDPQSFSVVDFIHLDNQVNSIVDRWVLKEVGTKITPDSKIAEISVFNLKLIYSNSKNGNELREFISSNLIHDEETDYLFSRIQDLYIYLKMALPLTFITFLQETHVSSIKKLGYSVDDEIVEKYEFGWLLSKIQHGILYHTRVTVKG